MLRQLVLLASLTAGVSVVAFAGGGCTGDPPPDLLQPKPKPQITDTGGYLGVMSAVGPDWVEVGPGWEGVTFNGKKLWDEKDSKKAKRVSAAGTLVGGDPQGLRPQGDQTYRLADLKVGDKVDIETGITGDGEEFCLKILVLRRPGGRIPRLPGERFPEHEREWHRQHQAYQDWEEKGVPIPKIYLNSRGRAPWTNPPYPPVAPMPRPARP